MCIRARTGAERPEKARQEMRIQIVVCCLLLSLVLWGIKLGIEAVLATWGLSAYFAVCVGGFLFFTAAAFAYDHLKARSR